MGNWRTADSGGKQYTIQGNDHDDCVTLRHNDGSFNWSNGTRMGNYGSREAAEDAIRSDSRSDTVNVSRRR